MYHPECIFDIGANVNEIPSNSPFTICRKLAEAEVECLACDETVVVSISGTDSPVDLANEAANCGIKALRLKCLIYGALPENLPLPKLEV